ncbi:hypothetical protein NHX12_030315 [Muraenolepis orangiensis]|uniref:Uncharacterized protein n=1 Tax=Muraenolepis orangiensis TaxID=630683 RepID=A0A9Q0ILQ5_9TELE|nr:hypothetical protein NHX12_030315 [Muraenolepis orangiensis]
MHGWHNGAHVGALLKSQCGYRGQRLSLRGLPVYWTMPGSVDHVRAEVAYEMIDFSSGAVKKKALVNNCVSGEREACLGH